jgi:RNA polymerase sigma factor (sigma-70 family)
MARSQTSGVIQHLRGAVLLEGAAGLSDAHLLDAFVRRREPSALELLVRRHAPMVWGVCHRVLIDHHDAEDAFQATFLVLVRRAASIAAGDLLANWLYGVAHRTALKARATLARRKEREKQVHDMPEPAAVERNVWDDVRPVLDRELACLPSRYRAVVVLCDLEGKTRTEAAGQLGLPEGTVASRLTRARCMLAKRLTRCGVGVIGVTLAAVLAPHVSVGAPAILVSAAIKSADQFAAGSAGAISANVVALTEGVLKAMLLSKIKTVASVLLAGACLGGLLLFWSGDRVGGQPGPQGERKPVAEAQAGLPPFTLPVGKYYQIILPNHQPWPGLASLVQVQKNYAGGWVEIRTRENHTTWLNLNQAMQVYLVEDPERFYREATGLPTGPQKK